MDGYVSDELAKLREELNRSQERNLYLEERNRNYAGILETLTSSSEFQADLNRGRDSAAIFKATQQQVKRLLAFACVGFYLTTDDSDFQLADCYPEHRKPEIEREVSARIADGSFAWALNQNHPVLHPAGSGDKTLVLHVLSTQSRIRGMFAALLPCKKSKVDPPSLNALSIILSNAAYALESATLYTLLRDHSLNLEQKVADRTRELLCAQQQAEAANRAKSAFLANMSHELRTPLNATIGFNDVVLSQTFGPLNPEQEEYLGYVQQSSRHLLDLINDILDLSKVEADMVQLELTDVSIRELLGNSLIMVKELAHRGGVQLQEAYAPDLPASVRGDERKLKQIIYNVLANAIKFTPAGGRVSVAAGPWSAPAGSETGLPRQSLRITIADTGIGLKKEDLQRIFNPFEQADTTATRDFEGTGLGLALTRKLLELHGGSIWAESDGPGKGSAFQLVLPTDNWSAP